jgi:ATPase subunit of ABC transporter with duplicated ATPase domains
VPAEFIYTTYKLSRHYPPDRTVLEDISISFYPGAKIGVIGANGSGKSSRLRIMAGLDDGYNGAAPPCIPAYVSMLDMRGRGADLNEYRVLQPGSRRRRRVPQ